MTERDETLKELKSVKLRGGYIQTSKQQTIARDPGAPTLWGGSSRSKNI